MVTGDLNAVLAEWVIQRARAFTWRLWATFCRRRDKKLSLTIPFGSCFRSCHSQVRVGRSIHRGKREHRS
jgi:hypothetical protein